MLMVPFWLLTMRPIFSIASTSSRLGSDGRYGFDFRHLRFGGLVAGLDRIAFDPGALGTGLRGGRRHLLRPEIRLEGIAIRGAAGGACRRAGSLRAAVALPTDVLHDA